ncbi:MAG: PSD1 and planctomycete cytochrome C domain-containing protein [Isosphaeraceae bacterium]
MRTRPTPWNLPLAGILLGLIGAGARADDGPAVSFERDVRPLLVGRCLDCHSGEKPSGGLDLTTRDGLLKGSETGPVVEPGDAAASTLVDVVTEGLMPPKKPDRLSADQVAVLKRWVEQGARWDGPALVPGSVTTDRRAGLDWWSLQPVRKPAVPQAGPASNPIDAFLLQKLAAEGLKPVGPADRPTLIRRLTFDLTGLPPTPEEFDTFVNDDRPDAYERLVDRLLASPRYGEKWARHWLDVVRFAESHGYEHDSPRPNAWPYRDYVIRSFNTDKPYDRFVAEQIAGDVISPGDPEAEAATGFLVAGPFDEVGSKVTSALMRANVRQDELEDLIGVTGQAFLGLTLQCARCHNHKFDPLTQDDYYRLQAILAGVRHGGVEADKPARYLPKRDKPEIIHVLHRGDVQSPGREVAPGVPRAVRGEFEASTFSQEGERRWAFAAWLVHPSNPLTARVAVNRLWQHHFGQGVVGTPSDFGFNGTRPTHPELLDWLASELVDQGWRLRPIHRLIVTSDAYRRSSRPDPAAQKVDADNRWLWRFSPRRLEAEEVRDATLAVSGRLVETPGGPGFALCDSKTNAGTLYRPVDRDGPRISVAGASFEPWCGGPRPRCWRASTAPRRPRRPRRGA